jgi:hypothetical protein
MSDRYFEYSSTFFLQPGSRLSSADPIPDKVNMVLGFLNLWHPQKINLPKTGAKILFYAITAQATAIVSPR